jgi:hypothetical protein
VKKQYRDVDFDKLLSSENFETILTVVFEEALTEI